MSQEGPGDDLVAIPKDGTGQRAREEELRAALEFREELFQTAQVVVLVLDRSGRIVDFNPFLERLSGIRLEDVRYQDWFTTFLPERDRERIREVFHRALAGTKTRGNINPIVTRDGRELEIEWYSSILTEHDGKVRGVLAIGHDVTERNRSERALAESERKLRQLSGTLLTAQEEERRHLSRELHDDLGQRVTVLGMGLEQLRTMVRKPRDSGDVERRLAELAGFVKDLGDLVSDMSRRLHPSIVEHLGLETALKRLCESVSKTSGKSIVLEVGPPAVRHPSRTGAMCLYRVAQEAIRNAIHHSGSVRVEVQLTRVDGGIRLSVRDYGQGFEMTGDRSEWGLGLVSMEERSRLARGKFEVASHPGRGTNVTCWVPSPRNAGTEPNEL